MTVTAGTLFVCGSPIGNLEDASQRLLRVLSEADLIAAEDTRHTRKLLSHFGISSPLTSFHAHSKEGKVGALIAELRQGRSVALVSDAGMPGISDPGGPLIAEVLAAGLPVEVIPGPSALLTALLLSGLRSDRFVFEGFLPRKGRRKALELWRAEKRTIVFYESPHRVLSTLGDILEVLGDRRIALCRELTKKFEETFRGTVSGAVAHFQVRAPKGEFTLVLEGAMEKADEGAGIPGEPQLRSAFEELLANGVDRRTAVKELAVRYGSRRREIYNALFGERP
ncbi:MAG: 16S rRNA (cytidine(1402)-2'-O)-methyltransferase [Firmicutes bacterium]|nr:16S rRNA (cytidine(1402)-2'-O)-methyltransferase [Bacillota bacterium]MBV1727994.1 16S rRNA (cytidine(1402)-2'-O)-methyltransferase [Desulforudis sp.]MBU4532965.1 16S rRNA (cytidine(1402)-2'-O)-methyltransferase [Bacillota bacterium]MBU4553928.1 16S rRNA (cytidine(1402)-2'-O)-methyltransferase [Bacillota bacterium]MBV1735018.1 16S rRNA (cytidine(1402)-2'-O)-methyltransferase [Desulforudis sp.]